MVKKTTALVLLLLWTALPLSAAETVKGPSIAFPNSEFDFGSTLEGNHVEHVFAVKNTGSEELTILNVKPGCGCTTASFTKKIAPGGEGTIKIVGNTEGYAGKVFSRSIQVISNDPNKSNATIHFRGFVKPFAIVTPDRVRLMGSEGEDLKETVRIVPAPGNPFKILSASPMDPTKMTVTLNTVTGANGPEYELTITNMMKTEGRYFGYISIGTDNTIKPEMKISVSVYIRKKA